MGFFKKQPPPPSAPPLQAELQPPPDQHQQQPGAPLGGHAASADIERAGAQPLPATHSAPAALPHDAAAAAQIDTLTPAQRRTLEHLQRLTRVMDSAVTIPIVKRKFGLDALIGLLPYVGDAVGATVGTYIISVALRYKMPKRLVARMCVNQAIDSCVGAVPFLGDIFDFGFKANSRNMRLLQEHLEKPKKATAADSCFLCGMFFLVVVLPLCLVVLVIGAIIVGICAAVGKLT